MVIALFSQRASTTAAITGLLLASGCRSASVNSTPSVSPPSSYFGSPPFFRSYEQSPRPYDDNEGSLRSPNPEPVPPSILPAPGSTEPELPPAPSAKRSRRGLVPSAFKLPATARQNSDMRQSGDQNDRGSLIKSKSDETNAFPTIDDSETLSDQTVTSRFSAAKDKRLLTTPQPLEPASAIAVNPASPPALGLPDEGSNTGMFSQGPIKTRYGVIQPWPNSNSTQAQAPKKIDNSNSNSAGEMPLLLPPSY